MESKSAFLSAAEVTSVEPLLLYRCIEASFQAQKIQQAQHTVYNGLHNLRIYSLQLRTLPPHKKFYTCQQHGYVMPLT
jgi:hypothetical protein